MGIRHVEKEELERLESKTLDAQFLRIVRSIRAEKHGVRRQQAK